MNLFICPFISMENQMNGLLYKTTAHNIHKIIIRQKDEYKMKSLVIYEKNIWKYTFTFLQFTICVEVFLFCQSIDIERINQPSSPLLSWSLSLVMVFVDDTHFPNECHTISGKLKILVLP